MSYCERTFSNAKEMCLFLNNNPRFKLVAVIDRLSHIVAIMEYEIRIIG